MLEEGFEPIDELSSDPAEVQIERNLRTQRAIRRRGGPHFPDEIALQQTCQSFGGLVVIDQGLGKCSTGLRWITDDDSAGVGGKHF